MGNELTPKQTPNELLVSMASSITAENFQKYVLGTKKDGRPRAIYDIVKDYTAPGKKKSKKKKKKHKHDYDIDPDTMYAIYMSSKKKKKKKKKNKHWHI